FGDNLSFISDTTIVATRTQGCRQSDKFRENVRIALPAALLTMIWYVVCGLHLPAYVSTGACDLVAILPYLFVFTAAMFGMDVMLVLVLGIIMASAIGLTTHALGVASLMKAMNDGMMGMSELIIVTLMASSMMAVIREAGGIDYILSHVVCHIKSARAAQLTMAALTVLTNICTANNTIAILTIGTVAREIARERGVSPRRAASVLDTFSCFTQGLLPYGAQLLIASGLAAVSPVEIIPYLYYPFILGICAFGYCLLQGRDLRNIVHKKTTKNKR
ncbi:MAG: Na+/H+ antiporter NhaC family protein, partial [Bacteroidaceae bacterium]|nr:Na+/H+ antiporter NhaC family protein [Bacteroidaceae bacterium]